MPRSARWIISALVLPAVLIVAGLAGAITIAFAAPDAGSQPAASFYKDGRDDDDDDGDDDNSGHGGGHGGDDRDDDRHGGDDDGRGDVARPAIPDADLGDVVVEIIDERFVPARFSLDAGQRVTFINLDDDEHTATGLGFDTGTLNGGEWATVKIVKGGEAPFVCQFHSEMQGAITVAGGDAVASPSPAPIALTPVGTPPSDTANEVVIDIFDVAFSDTALEIPIGTTVTWVNQGQAPHTVTGGFADSGVLQPGQSFSFTFTEAGAFNYLCQLHPNMTAQIIVA